MMDDAENIKKEIVSTSVGEIGVTGGILESNEQKIRMLAENELRIIEIEVKKSRRFIQKYTGKNLTGTLKDLKLFDYGFKVWMLSEDLRKEKNDEVVNSLGAAFGQLMVKELNMEWVVVNDKYGEDWAIQHKDTGIISYPYSSIYKRIVSKKTDFMEPIFYVVQKSIDEKL